MTDAQSTKIVDLLSEISEKLSSINTDNKTDVVFKPQEAAEYLRISYDNLLDCKDEIPHFKIGERFYFRKSTIDTWIRNQELQSFNLTENSGGDDSRYGKIRKIKA